ncbi:MAG: HIT family protein [Candidatus Pacebacteria bacterium]|nr:HIT family protein [Candidatus Paceibacterota bacterium]
MENCIFCKIIDKEVPCYKIYEDELVLAFLDINPVVEGHALIIPKKHFENIFDIEEEYLERIIKVSKKISLKMKEAMRIEGINLYQANGSIAGQTVFHFHLHVLPRKEGDKIDFIKWTSGTTKQMEKEQFEEIRNKLIIT